MMDSKTFCLDAWFGKLRKIKTKYEWVIMRGLSRYLKKTNKELKALGLPELKNFMYTKNFIGIEANHQREPIFVCKAPTHVIKTQSESPDFHIYGYYKNKRLVALMIKIYDLKMAPFVIFSHFITPFNNFSSKKIGCIGFVNEADENILGVKLSEEFHLNNATPLKTTCVQDPSALRSIQQDKSVTRRLLCSASSIVPVEHLVHRESDKNTSYVYNLSEDLPSEGEHDVFGHGKRLEDMVHFYSTAIRGAQIMCGPKYKMDPLKSGEPGDELCDELIISDDWALFIQEKSIITKKILRDSETISSRTSTIGKRINQAATQLLKHINAVKAQGDHISTEIGMLTFPTKKMGLIVVTETFQSTEFFNVYKSIVDSNPLFSEIMLTVMSVEDYIWMVKGSAGDSSAIRSTLEQMHANGLRHRMLGTFQCNLSIAQRISEEN
jgi:hypothetical protein